MALHSDYIIMGGGISGLTLAAILAAKGRDVRVIERNNYPEHRVCGEYLSNEVIPFMKAYDLLPDLSEIPAISKFMLSDTRGKSVEMDLDLGGIGISRHLLDNHLFLKAKQKGALFSLNEKVTGIQFQGEMFGVETDRNQYSCKWLIGAFGKRSAIDRILKRPFMLKRSPYVGVKYHVKNADFPRNLVSLHNFNGGYCGVNAVEDDKVNICYLAHRDSLRKAGNIRDLESSVLCKNPLISEIFQSSEWLWQKPLVINEISFDTKSTSESHIFMCGDAAGMITPLCGNGMAMAMHSAFLLARALLAHDPSDMKSRGNILESYNKQWRDQFALRLSSGRIIQRLFGRGYASNLTVALGRNFPSAGTFIMKQTHGQPFV